MSLYRIFGWRHPLLSGKKKSIKTKDRNTRHRWHWAWKPCFCFRSCAAFLNRSSRKPERQVLTWWDRFLAQISHHEEETHPAWGLTFLLTCPMFSSAYVAYSSTWNKNSLLPPTQPLAPLLFLAKISNSRVDGWARSSSKPGRSTEHSHGLLLQLFHVCFWWLVLTYSWGTGINSPTHPFLCFLRLFCLP